MAFTDEDRNLLIATATRVENMEGWMENLPCQQHPPECTQESRLTSLETTRSRGIGAAISVAILAFLAGLKLFLAKIGG